jgi:hypothetical protein
VHTRFLPNGAQRSKEPKLKRTEPNTARMEKAARRRTETRLISR